MQTWLGIDIGIRNLSCCLLKLQDKKWTIEAWELYDLLQLCDNEFKNCNELLSTDVHSVSDFVLPKLFKKSYITKQINHICIEQQPHGKYGNQKLVLFSHLMYSYFQRMLCDIKFTDILTSVRFISANSKYCQTWLRKYSKSKQKVYGARKKLSVELVRCLWKDYNITNLSKTDFDTHSKKDDLADAFLLAFHSAIFFKY